MVRRILRRTTLHHWKTLLLGYFFHEFFHAPTAPIRLARQRDGHHRDPAPSAVQVGESGSILVARLGEPWGGEEPPRSRVRDRVRWRRGAAEWPVVHDMATFVMRFAAPLALLPVAVVAADDRAGHLVDVHVGRVRPAQDLVHARLHDLVRVAQQEHALRAVAELAGDDPRRERRDVTGGRAMAARAGHEGSKALGVAEIRKQAIGKPDGPRAFGSPYQI